MKMTTLKGIFPDSKPVRRKNFIHENVKSLRRMEECFRTNKKVEELQKLQLHKHYNTAGKVTNFRGKKSKNECADLVPKDNDNLMSRDNASSVSKSNIDLVSNHKPEDNKQVCKESNVTESDKKQISNKKLVQSSINNNNNILARLKRQVRTNKRKSQQKLQSKVSSEPNVFCKSDNTENNTNAQSIVKYKNQGIQTLDTDQTETIYSEGIILYPSEKITRYNEITSTNELDQQNEKITRKQLHSPSDRGDMHTSEVNRELLSRNSGSPAHKEEINFIKLNKERTSVANKLATQLNNGAPLNYRKGVVPKYLRERKEAYEKEQKAKAEMSHPDCPEGHVLLSDNERKETLRLLKKNYQDYVNELNTMPIKTDTLRAQRRKIEIEKQLNKLEEGIKVFSRPKVFVKINA